MNTENKRITYLIHKVTDGLANDQEIRELEKWYYSFDGDEKYTSYLNDQQKNLFKNNLFKEIEIEVTKADQHKAYQFKRYYKIFAAAVLLLIGSAALYYANQLHNVTPFVKNHEIKDVLPGGNKATLTLANGKTIILDETAEGDLTQIGNTNITKSSNGEIVYTLTGSARDVTINTLSTPKGGVFKLSLPDGTQVWLNAGSSISYPSAFVGRKRSVSITGEAYFEVAKNAEMPFYVQSGTQEIVVLGTHFNIKAYGDESNVTTTLLEGGVRIIPRAVVGQGNVRSEILKPGEQAVLSNSNIKISAADTDQATAWKNGYFHFEETEITEVMRQLSRWYNVDVLYEGQVNQEKFFGKINRTYTLAEVLSVLQTGDLHFKIEQGNNKGQKTKLILLP